MTAHACEMCGKSGADHETPSGEWIHSFCGMNLWQRIVAKHNALMRRTYGK